MLVTLAPALAFQRVLLEERRLDASEHKPVA
jgi:hypothetical protein